MITQQYKLVFDVQNLTIVEALLTSIGSQNPVVTSSLFATASTISSSAATSPSQTSNATDTTINISPTNELDVGMIVGATIGGVLGAGLLGGGAYMLVRGKGVRIDAA